MASDTAAAHMARYETAVRKIAATLMCSHIGWRNAPWGVGAFLGFQDGIQDMRPFLTFDMEKQQKPPHEVLGPEWQIIGIAP
jgi:hypothetical protein